MLADPACDAVDEVVAFAAHMLHGDVVSASACTGDGAREIKSWAIPAEAGRALILVFHSVSVGRCGSQSRFILQSGVNQKVAKVWVPSATVYDPLLPERHG